MLQLQNLNDLVDIEALAAHQHNDSIGYRYTSVKNGFQCSAHIDVGCVVACLRAVQSVGRKANEGFDKIAAELEEARQNAGE